jgi:uncharacterized protein (DUF983 family)/8-oxo-dGTP pyrophosphatase MutT (NUDIX family)
MTRGFMGRCPSCGRGRLFRSYLGIANACGVCGEEFSGHRADDAPSYITLLIVAHIVGGGVLMSDETWPNSSLVWVAAFWLFVTVVASVLILPRAKGAIVGQQWALSPRQNVIDPASSPRAMRPRDAATLIVVEHSDRGPARVLMGKRHAGHRFMPGKFVFPGGRVEPEDRRMAATGALDAHVEEKLNARVRRPSPSFARALALAAIRETFEETGLAIGVPDYGAPENPPPGAWTRFAATGVLPALDAIDFLARAITPPGRPRRFDARFLVIDARFIAKRVEGAVHAEAELVELVWTPLDEARSLDLPAITHMALDDLAQALEGGLDKRRPRPFYREIRGKRLREHL